MCSSSPSGPGRWSGCTPSAAGLAGGLLLRLGPGGWRLRDDLARSIAALADLAAVPTPRRLE